MKIKHFFVCLLAVLIFSGCSKDDPITRVVVLESTETTSTLTEAMIDQAEILSIRGTMNQGDFEVLKDNRTVRFLSLENATVVGTVTVANQDYYTGNAIPASAFGLDPSDQTSQANTYLAEIIMPTNVQVIGTSAFEGCTSLNAAYMTNNIQKIYPSAFEGCTSLSGSIWMPSSLLSIGEYAFDGCLRLNGVLILNEDLETIGGAAFAATRLKQINAPWNVQSDIPTLDLALPFFPEQFVNGQNNYIVIPKGTTSIYTAAWDNGSGKCYYNLIENNQ
ncbi:MAG: leucine-rich repeat domain-containing protein [Flavobacteriales bacterium]|nr:leucine-rich repeat domain-containing protein [Flavobacteriales bacterium]